MIRGLGVSSQQQQLSGPADALQVRAQHSVNQADGSLPVRLVITNMLVAVITGALITQAYLWSSSR